MTIHDKQTFKKLSMANKLGNRFQAFDTVEEAVASGIEGFYIRGPVAQWPHMVPWCLAEALETTVRRIEALGESRGGMQFVEVLPFGTVRSINAEAARDECWLTLTYGTSSTMSLRDDVMENGIHVQGLSAWRLLQEKVPPEDVDMLCDIWSDYPVATIEFSTWPNKHIGIMKRSTIIWEVRSYLVLIGMGLLNYGWQISTTIEKVLV